MKHCIVYYDPSLTFYDYPIRHGGWVLKRMRLGVIDDWIVGQPLETLRFLRERWEH